MFSEKKNLVLFIMLIFVMSFSSVVLYADCDMFGMLLRVPHFLGHFQCVNFFNFLFKSQSKFLWS